MTPDAFCRWAGAVTLSRIGDTRCRERNTCLRP
jgi:hypothetical protein